MAIKTISQLDRFNDGSPSQTIGTVGGNLRLYKGTISSNGDFITVDNEPHGARLEELSSSYRYSLFEMSQPQTSATDLNTEFYYSKHIPYANLVKNIIADTKQYLNVHNGLFQNNVETIAHDDYTFTGHKRFDFGGVSRQSQGNGGVEILGGLSADIVNADIVNISGGLSCCVPFDARPILFDASLSVGRGLSCNELTVNASSKFNGDIDASDKVVSASFFTGGAYCLKDDETTTANIPNGYTIFTEVGNPVCFVNGRPHALSSVLMAEKAKNLVKSDGTIYDVGNGEVRTSSYTNTYSAVFFKDGIPVETNVIDYAEHAYWSDLGEKYLGEEQYEPGTLVKFGGKNEITVADTEVNAIVSTKAFDLNAGLKEGTVIALCGRVPTKVIGKVKKFDKVVLSSIPGVARAKKWYDFFKKTIGRALESNDIKEVKLVECVTRFTI